MRLPSIFLVLALILVVAAPASAAEPYPRDEDPRELALQGLERLMQAFDSFVRTVPLYALPEITEEGDIIIRRLPPRERPETAPRPAPRIENREI